MALFETAIALALSVSIAVTLQTLAHIAIASAVAPLLLLRSDASTAQAQKWFVRGLPRWNEFGEFSIFLLGPVFLWLILWSVIVRIAATVLHPISGLKALPANWKRVVLCTDSRTPVELVPTVGSIPETIKGITNEELPIWSHLLMFTVYSVLAAIVHFARRLSDSWIWFGITWWIEALMLLGASTFVLGMLCYVVALTYRYSLKSTSLLWLPMIYVVRDTFHNPLPLAARLKELRTSALWRLIRAVAWTTVLLFGAKLIVLPNVIEWWNNQPFATIFNVYVMPNRIHPWHIAAMINASIALVSFYVFFDRAPRYLKHGAWSEAHVLLAMKSVAFIRGTISIYTIAVGIILTFQAAKHMNCPELSGKLFP